MFARRKNPPTFSPEAIPERITSVLGPGINWKGDLRGKGGVRIEGTLEGEIRMQGLVVVGESGKVICQQLQAETVIVAGTVKGDITCQKLEIRATGRVWGNIVTTSFSSDDGAFLRGQMRMEEKVEIQSSQETELESRELPTTEEPEE